ncbi:MAG: RNA polymerase sigma factor [Bacteroidia bacterium]|nr:RNA polymerase sigma factor [Bacteroidia bacterium]
MTVQPSYNFPALYLKADGQTMNGEGYKISEKEQKLITDCLTGDRRAQKELYDRYKDAMYTLCYRITNDFDLAQDVLQEAFIGVFKGIAGFRRASSLGAWIKTIVVRTAYRKIRREVVMTSLEDEKQPETIDWGHTLDTEYLEQAIQSLPPGYRSVFVLIEIEGYSHKEVAEMMGISTGTSKSQLYYAKKQLQKKLKGLGVR